MDNQNLQNAEQVVENVEEIKQAAEQASAAAESTVETAAYSYTASYDEASEPKSGLNVLGLVAMILGILSLVAAGVQPFLDSYSEY